VENLFILTDILPSYQVVLAKDANVWFSFKAVGGEWPEMVVSSRQRSRRKAR
jgi:hypothetical protein